MKKATSLPKKTKVAMAMESKAKSVAVKVFFVVLLVALLLVELARIAWGFDGEPYQLLSRLLGGMACLLFMVDFSFTKILLPTGNKKPLLWLLVIPGFLIAINNFPFLSYAMGDCSMSADAKKILFFAAICLATGFFEEMAFRGCAFMLLLKSRTQSKGRIFLAIFLSSVVFGLIHFVNLFFGASPISVLLQIGYSALIGALCSMVLLLTGNIWLCVALHAIYNFCGGLIENFGSGIQWTAPEIALTAVLAVIVAAYFVILFFKMPNQLAVNLFFEKNERENNEIDS